MSEQDLFFESTTDQAKPRHRRPSLQSASRTHPIEPDRRFQVFVSSTYRDLRSERQEVIQALLELECIPAGMELFLATDEDQWSLIESVIDDCDYYVLIVGGRYGSMTEAGVSYTEREYDYAVARGIPILAFLHVDPGGLPSRDVEGDPHAVAKLESFREKARSRPIRTFSSPADLGSVVSRSLVRLMKRQPGEGWVRGRYAKDLRVEAEIARLRTEVAELELELAQLTKKQRSQYDKEQIEAIEQVAQVEYTFGGRPRARQDTWRGTWNYRWARVFQLMGAALMDEASDEQLADKLAGDIHASLRRIDFGNDIYGAYVSLASNSLDDIKVTLRAMGLIEPGKRRRPVTDSNAYWSLSDHGETVLMQMSSTTFTPNDALQANGLPQRAD